MHCETLKFITYLYYIFSNFFLPFPFSLFLSFLFFFFVFFSPPLLLFLFSSLLMLQPFATRVWVITSTSLFKYD